MLVADILAVDLSVAAVIRRFCAPESAMVRRVGRAPSLCFPRRNSLTINLAGVEGLFGPAGLTPPGPPSERYPSLRGSPSRAMFKPSDNSSHQLLAGVEGFEPPYGGIKTRCLTAWRHPNGNQHSARRRGPGPAVTARRYPRAACPASCSGGRRPSHQGRVVQSANQKRFDSRRRGAHDLAASIHRIDP